MDFSFIKNIFKSPTIQSSKLYGTLYNDIEVERQKFKELYDDYKKSEKWNIEYSFLLNKVTDHMNTLVWHKDKNHKYLLANPLHCELFFGLDSTCLENIEGRTDQDLIKKYYIDQNIQNTFGDICLLSDQYVVTQNTNCYFLEAGVIDGQEVLFYIIKAPQFDKDGQFIGTLGLGWDLTFKSGNIIQMVNRLKYDNSITILFEKDCVWCYALGANVLKCQIFNHPCINNY